MMARTGNALHRSLCQYQLCVVILIYCVTSRLMYSCCSFFVVEDHILHTTQGLVNRAYVEELWELALSKTIAALRTHSVCSYSSLSIVVYVLYIVVPLPGYWMIQCLVLNCVRFHSF